MHYQKTKSIFIFSKLNKVKLVYKNKYFMKNKINKCKTGIKTRNNAEN